MRPSGALLGVLGGVAGGLLDDVAELNDRASEPVVGRDDVMVAAADVPEERLQLRAGGRALAGLLLGEGPVAIPYRLKLPCEVLAGR